MENINKIAGPFVEAWAVEVFQDVVEDTDNRYTLINVEAKERLYMADVILQFKKKRKVESGVTAEGGCQGHSGGYQIERQVPQHHFISENPNGIR